MALNPKARKNPKNPKAPKTPTLPRVTPAAREAIDSVLQAIDDDDIPDLSSEQIRALKDLLPPEPVKTVTIQLTEKEIAKAISSARDSCLGDYLEDKIITALQRAK